MSNTEKSLEKAAAIFEKLPLDEAIEVYHELGRKIHNRIVAKQQETELQLKKLKGE